jgi:hypothetical protein
VITAIRAALSGVWGYIAAAGAALLAIGVLLASAKKAGKNEVLADSAQKEVDNARQAHEIEREVAVTKPDARRDELRKYERD